MAPLTENSENILVPQFGTRFFFQEIYQFIQNNYRKSDCIWLTVCRGVVTWSRWGTWAILNDPIENIKDS